MKLETFFDNFEVLAEAPNGVQKLRELILQLAVRGKLVAQDEGDEPADVLIEKIKDEKRNLIKAKKIKKIDSFTTIEPEEIRFDIPDKWNWVRFGEITICRDGERIPVSKDERETRQKIYDYYGASGIIDKIDGYLFDKPLLLIGEDGANLLNRSTPIAFIAQGKYWVNNHAHVIDSISFDCLRYIEVFINAINLAPYVTGTAQPKMNQEKMNSIAVSFPPLAEQRRIIAKVDQLMSLCDELEARQKKKRESRALMNSAALDRMLSARAPGEFAEGWRRISDNFDLLYDAPENVGALRQAILHFAVIGKLVKQDTNEEQASFLLEKIRIQKEMMIKEKKIRKIEPLKPIEEGEIPDELPRGWQWVRLGNLCFNITDGFHNTPKPTISGIPYLTAQHIRPNFLDFNNCLYVSEKDHKELVSKTRPTKGDLLLVNIGAGCGTPAIINVDFEFSFKNVAIFNKPKEIYSGYLYYYFLLKRSSFFEQLTKGGAQPFLSLGVLRNIPFPLPPLAEQHRIVARVDQLMSLCDKLEAGLMRSQADSERLMEVVVGKMLAGGDNAEK